jgi:hypothetical protein
MRRIVAVGMLVAVGAGWAGGAIVVPWDAGKQAYYLNLPMTTSYPPETTSGTFVNHNNDKWITGSSGASGSGTWHFELANGAHAKEVKVEIRVYNRGDLITAGYHVTWFGLASGSITNRVGDCFYNEVPAGGGYLWYTNTFSGLDAAEFYVKHDIVNGWGYNTAQQLRAIRITAVPPQGTVISISSVKRTKTGVWLATATLCGLTLVRRRRRAGRGGDEGSESGSSSPRPI